MNRSQSRPWNLVADIGGTNARFGLQDTARGELTRVINLAVADFVTFDAALEACIEQLSQPGNYQQKPDAACIAVACPAEGDTVRFTNSSWEIQRQSVARRLDLHAVDIINDFAAVGHAVTTLGAADWQQLGVCDALDTAPIAVIGPGTGLGVCCLVWSGDRYLVVEGEGGHVDFAPVDDVEIEVHKRLRDRFGRVSSERVLSGAGIANVYQALCDLEGTSANLSTPEAISAAAIQGTDTTAVRTLEMLFATLGSMAGNQALTLGARGGVYIAGGIVPKLLPMASESRLYERFLDKGRFRAYLETIPLRLITRDNLGLVGCMRYLDTR